jgi:hypothetical protein
VGPFPGDRRLPRLCGSRAPRPTSIRRRRRRASWSLPSTTHTAARNELRRSASARAMEALGRRRGSRLASSSPIHLEAVPQEGWSTRLLPRLAQGRHDGGNTSVRPPCILPRSSARPIRPAISGGSVLPTRSLPWSEAVVPRRSSRCQTHHRIWLGECGHDHARKCQEPSQGWPSARS